MPMLLVACPRPILVPFLSKVSDRTVASGRTSPMQVHRFQEATFFPIHLLFLHPASHNHHRWLHRSGRVSAFLQDPVASVSNHPCFPHHLPSDRSNSLLTTLIQITSLAVRPLVVTTIDLDLGVRLVVDQHHAVVEVARRRAAMMTHAAVHHFSVAAVPTTIRNHSRTACHCRRKVASLSCLSGSISGDFVRTRVYSHGIYLPVYRPTNKGTLRFISRK